MNVSPLRLDAAAPIPARLWRVDLDQPVPTSAYARLSAEEIARAGRFVFPRDRQRYIAAHAALRQLLAQRLSNGVKAEPEPLTFVAGRHGKPALAAPTRLHFNLSHSHGVALVALSDDCELGVDIEQIRPMTDATAMAAAYFTSAEQAALAACEADAGAAARDRAFFTCWTRKEACLKAFGIGLYLATHGFEVGVLPAARTVEIATPEGLERVHLQSFEDDDIVGAIALRDASCAPARTSRETHSAVFSAVEVHA